MNTRASFKRVSRKRGSDVKAPSNKALIETYLEKSFYKRGPMKHIPPCPSSHLYFYLLSQTDCEYGVYGITNNPYRRVGEYMEREEDCINFNQRLKTQLWYGRRDDIFSLETKIKHTIKRFQKYNHLLVLNRNRNQVEFFPSEYREEMRDMICRFI
jgi:hypothetical protein